MTKKLNNMTHAEQKRFFDIFMASGDRDFEFMRIHYNIHPNTMKVIIRNEISDFIKKKDRDMVLKF